MKRAKPRVLHNKARHLSATVAERKASDKCEQRDKIPRDKWHANKAMSNYQERRVTADEDAESVDQTRSTSSASRRNGAANSRQSRPSTSRDLVTWSSLQIQEESCNHQQADMCVTVASSNTLALGARGVSPCADANLDSVCHLDTGLVLASWTVSKKSSIFM
jgi:hypothetical protein